MIFIFSTLGLLCFVILLLLVWWLGYCGPARLPEPLPSAKILDMHCHSAGLGYGGSGCFVSAGLQDSWKFKFYIRSFNVTIKELKEHGDSLIVQKISEKIRKSQYVAGAVILAMDGMIGPNGKLDKENTEIYIPNEFVASEVKKYDNLYFGTSINPYRTDAIERLAMAANDCAVLMKWIPSTMHINPSDEKIIPFYKKLIKYNLPLLCHTGYERTFTWARNEMSDPKRLELPLKLGVTVIAAHIATTGKNEGEENMSRLIPMFDKYPNLYADISSLTQINKLGYLSRVLKKSHILDRLMYGTDYPLTETGICLPLYHAFNLTPKEIVRLQRIKNPWDRDIKLKQALGVPADIFARSAETLQIRLG
jgi:predicted TIM-barrel fold metal-dependent hydrolase